MRDKLPDETLNAIADWINAGAPFGEKAESLAGSEKTVADVTLGTGTLFEQVKPVLENQCVVCHGGNFKQAGLDISTRETLLRGSDNGPVVVPGDAGASLLVKKIRHEHQPGMPHKRKKLAEEAIARIVDWINSEVPYDMALRMTNEAEKEAILPGTDHWAFQVPKRPPIPKVKNKQWVKNPIDRFIAVQHEKRGLKPLPEADKRTLLRRVYLDLIGLPPTPEEIRAFLADDRENAYEKVVDRLLLDSRYGERWGRHWLDIWRYSDWYGYGDQIRNSKPHIWRWRDWIIESLNNDKPYDRMILEMLAGDEIAPTDSDILRATGYLARNFYMFSRNVWLQDTVEHTAAGFLGLTMKCARCHDHKYDPIAQEEYYRLRAFFEPHDARIDRVPSEPDTEKDGLTRIYEARPRGAKNQRRPVIFAETYRLIGGDEKKPDKDHPLSPGVPLVLGGNDGLKIEKIELPVESYYPALRPIVRQDLIDQQKAKIKEAEEGLEKARSELAEARRRVSEQRPEIGAAEPSDSSLEKGSAEMLAEMVFDEKIKPIFKDRCFSCHNTATARSGLSLERIGTILQGGDKNGPVAIPGNSQGSPLIQHLRGEKEPRMPLEGDPLPKEEIAAIGKWIDRLPPEDPEVTLQRAEAKVVLAEKELASEQADLPALEARIAAEAKYIDRLPEEKVQELAEVARKAKRRAHLLQAEVDLLQGQQQLLRALRLQAADEEEKYREKKIAAARQQVQAAEKELGAAIDKYTPVGTVYPKTSSGRRTALAKWIGSQDNPLTARVGVNHMWKRHFGEAIVVTVANLGLSGEPPSHAKLLDWLAVEFMQSGWSMKHMHRLMVTSNPYKMRSWTANPVQTYLEKDPENRYLWHMNRRRMEAELVRDSILYVAGKLNDKMGGPPIHDDKGSEVFRRSLYFHQSPHSQMLFLKVFDAADPLEAYKRPESITPQQALAMLNAELSTNMARILARDFSDKFPNQDDRFVEAAFERILGRPPRPEELTASRRFLQEQARLLSDPQQLTAYESGPSAHIPPAEEPALRSREDLVQVLFSHNDFVTIE